MLPPWPVAPPSFLSTSNEQVYKVFNNSECEYSRETCDPQVYMSLRCHHVKPMNIIHGKFIFLWYLTWHHLDEKVPSLITQSARSLPRRSTPRTSRLSVLTPSACLPSTVARPSTTSTSSCSSSTTCSSSSGAPTSLRPWARSRCRGPSPPTTGPLRSPRIFRPFPSSPLWDGPSG